MQYYNFYKYYKINVGLTRSGINFCTTALPGEE